MHIHLDTIFFAFSFGFTCNIALRCKMNGMETRFTCTDHLTRLIGTLQV